MGHRVVISALDCEENRSRMRLEAPHCEVAWFNKGSVIKEVGAKIQAIRKVRPDVVYSTSYALRNLALLRCLLPRSTCMVLEFCELYSHYSSKNHLLWWVLEAIACFENDRLLCASKFLEGYFKSLVGKLCIRRQVIYSPYAYPDYLRPLGCGSFKQKTVVFMASLWKGYGAYDVPEACMKLLGRYPGLQVEVLGGGPEKDNLRKLMKDRGVADRVHVRGFVAEETLKEYFSRADVFVSPLHDTLQDKARCPSKIFYYIPYNKPIVTCALGDPLETLGEFGFYYKPDDIDDMSRAIDSALSASDGFSYPKGFIERHTWTARARQLAQWITSDD